ncbi:hypothetical protein GIW81_00870 [Hyphomicrobium sp. xq]|uniref:Uncharacterized protein n=1 Tax=Hyphomicrobium album TaxID=2665159 RepID=A0A6I3KFV3_9HYPH|nr:hypothetical protein [Hyphomicrobium album]MTD92880.1 hypothetical protein [Hyphomicrobium album]
MAIKRPAQSEPQRLRASAQAVNTFVRPEAPLLAPDAAQPTALLRLADSLRNVSPAMARLGESYRAANEEAGESEALGLRLKTETAELTARINSGDIPEGVNRMALDMGHGEDIARQDFEDLRKRYLGESTVTPDSSVSGSNAFDRDTGDVDAWFAGVAREGERRVPKTEAALYGYRKQMDAFRKQLIAEQTAYSEKRTKEANLDAAYKDLYGTAVGSVSSGERDPAKIHANMRDAFDKTRRIHMLTPGETDEAMAVAANSIAVQGIPGNPALGVELVKEIFLGARDGAPPLGGSAKYADIASKTIEQAQKTAGELQRKLNVTLKVDFTEAASTGTLDEKRFIGFTEANSHVFSQAEREGILIQNRNALQTAREKNAKVAEKLQLEAVAQASEQSVNHMLDGAGKAGTLLTIPERTTYTKADGSTATYGRQELIDRGVENKLAELDAWAQAETAKPENKNADIPGMKFDRELDYFKRNPVKHPQWADVLNAGYSSAAPDTLAAANTAPPHLLQAVELYEKLEAKSPGLLERHLNSQGAKDFYQTYRTARTLLRQDERQALHTAALATKGVQDEVQFQPAYDKVETELAKAGSIWPWAQGIENYGEMLTDIRRLGRVLVRGNVNPEAALQAAGEAVRKQYTNINGYMLRTSDRNIESWDANMAAVKLQPRKFEETVLDYLQRYASDQHDPSTLSIRPMTNGVGTWAVIDAVTGFPIESNSGLSPQFSIRDLLQFEKDVQEGNIEEKLKELRRPPKSMAPHNLIRRAFGFEDTDLFEDDAAE